MTLKADEFNSVVIFSVKLPHHTAQQETAHINEALSTLGNYSPVLGLGVYDGEPPEFCIAAFPDTRIAANVLADVALRDYCQRTVVRLGDVQKNGSREAVLQHAGGLVEHIGYWREISPVEAMEAAQAGGGYTYIPGQSAFYVAK